VLFRSTDPSARERYLTAAPDGERLAAAWYSTVGARLVGLAAPNVDALGFLRLVHVSPFFDARLTGRPLPAGAIWERVAGARVEASGAAGERLEIVLELAYPDGATPFVFRATAAVGPDGVARVRVPYATDAPNGELVARGPVKWRLGAANGELSIPEHAVLGGEPLRAH
jgi:hypothetical protein